MRRYLPISALLAGSKARRRGHRSTGRLLTCIGAAGLLRTYSVSRRVGRVQTAEHMARMRRLRPSVLQHFYITCIASMELELEAFPRYDRRKHEMRYRIVADLAAQYAPRGGTVVDVGCASGLVLDSVNARRGTRGIGFDLAPYGLHQRGARPQPPVLAQAVVEHIPLPDGIADVVVFSEVIEHLIDAAAGMKEVGRITRLGGHMVLTTNNASEMPEISPLRDPLTYVERVVARRWPRVLAFRNITWAEPINREADPLPDDAPTYAPHVHYAAVELRRLAAAAGMEPVTEGSFEFPVPQSRLALGLRRLSQRHERAGDLASDAIERVISVIPGLNLMGTHNLQVFRKVRETPSGITDDWWHVTLPLAEEEVPAPRPVEAAGR